MQLFCLKARQDLQYIQESRMIREAQDQAYAESLRVDKEKKQEQEKAKADKAKREQVTCRRSRVG